jgi:hypothetical protein
MNRNAVSSNVGILARRRTIILRRICHIQGEGSLVVAT